MGRYNEELLEKYEPPSASSDDEEDDTGDAEEEEEEEVDLAGTEVTSTVSAPTESAAPAIPDEAEAAVPTVAEHGEIGSQVEAAVTEGGDEHEEWLDAIVSTPIPSLAAAGLEASAVTDEPAAAAIASVDTEVEEPELTVVRGEDSVFKVVPRTCKDANK